MLYETLALQQAYAAQTGLREVLKAYCMTEFFENKFTDFFDVVHVEKNQDFVQPLVAFPISNISYYVQLQTTISFTLMHRF